MKPLRTHRVIDSHKMAYWSGKSDPSKEHRTKKGFRSIVLKTIFPCSASVCSAVPPSRSSKRTCSSTTRSRQCSAERSTRSPLPFTAPIAAGSADSRGGMNGRSISVAAISVARAPSPCMRPIMRTLSTVIPESSVHAEGVQRRNPHKLFSRTCAKCGKSIQTTYSPERPEVVYCEQCYLAAVY